MFNMTDVSPVNIVVGFISELIKLNIGDYIPTICLVIIVVSALLSILAKVVNISLITLVLAWGTISLALAEFTPIFTWISYLVILLLKLLQVPNAVQAAPAVLVGFTDMFIPSVMLSGDGFAEITKFIIGALSISQLVYMIETGAVILKSDIPLKLKDLIIIFLIRTVISLLVITPIAHMLF